MFNLDDRIAIYGSDNFAMLIIKKIIEYGRQKISAIISNNANEKNIFGILVYSLENAIKMHFQEFDKILIVEEMPYENEKYLSLYNNGVSDIYVLIKESEEIFNSNNVISESCIQHFNLKNKPVLRYIELHIVDFCNLNCKGCTHFSNVCNKSSDSIISIESLEIQLKKLSILCDVSIIRLMGGEPLLHPKLEQILSMVRNIFPNARIFLVTNALLLTHMKENLCKSIKKNNVFINISLYKPTVKLHKQIENFLNNKSIIYFWGNGEKIVKEEQKIKTFHKCLSTKQSKNRNACIYCYNKYCWFLRNGKISKCSYPLLIEIINKKFSMDYQVNTKDFIDIFKVINGWEIVEFLNSAIPFCKYCRDTTIEFQWKSGRIKADLEDYVI